MVICYGAKDNQYNIHYKEDFKNSNSCLRCYWVTDLAPNLDSSLCFEALGETENSLHPSKFNLVMLFSLLILQFMFNLSGTSSIAIKLISSGYCLGASQIENSWSVWLATVNCSFILSFPTKSHQWTSSVFSAA